MSNFIFPNIWTGKHYNDFEKYILSLCDPKSAVFESRVVNTSKKVLGVKTKLVRQIASAVAKTDILSFLKFAKNDIYEIMTIKALVIAKIKDIDQLKPTLISFVDEIDNWATCDMLCGDLKIVGKNQKEFVPIILDFLNSKAEFTQRVAIVLLFKYYFDDYYIAFAYENLLNFCSEKYYVNMAIAWFICEMYLKQKEYAIKFLNNANVSKFAINKGICKIRDSFRVEKTDKEYVLQYRR